MIKVGVIDTGVDYSHPILSDFIDLEASISFVDDSIKDYSGHGTGVCGLIVYDNVHKTDDYHDLNIIMAKVTNNNNFKLSTFIEAIEYLISLDVDIINLSLSIKNNNNKYHDQIIKSFKNAIDKDIIIVASTGNYNVEKNILLDIIDDIFLVTSINYKGKIASYSKIIQNSYISIGGDLENIDSGQPDKNLVYSSYPTYLENNYFNIFGVAKNYNFYYGTSIATARFTNKIIKNIYDRNILIKNNDRVPILKKKLSSYIIK